MNTKYDEILIDLNSIGYAAHGAQVLKNKTHGEVQSIFFSLKMIKKAVDTFSKPGETSVIGLWDSHAKWRYDILPEYKGKRDDDPVKKASRQEYKRQVPVIRKFLHAMGVEQRFAKGDEADDLASTLSHNRAIGVKTLLVSGDHDWLQLVCEDVDWYDPRGPGIFVSRSNFREFTGFKSPSQFSQAKAILGDSSDNVKGVAGLGDKAVALIFNKWGSIPKLFEWAESSIATGEFMRDDLPPELSRWRKPMSEFIWGEGKERFKRNMRLMNLLSKRHRGTEILGNQIILKAKFDKDSFENMCHEYAFMSIITSMPKWQKTFE